MIRYSLNCNNGHEFESWFKSSDACDNLLTGGFVECPECGSTSVKKSLMTPAIPKKGSSVKEENTVARTATFDWVGDKFADEALKMHNGETEERNILGTVTEEDTKKLEDNGVDFIKVDPNELKKQIN